MRGRKGKPEDDRPGLRCLSRRFDSLHRCQLITGHEGYHLHDTGVQTFVWRVGQGTGRP